jgi:hypothetical protein
MRNLQCLIVCLGVVAWSAALADEPHPAPTARPLKSPAAEQPTKAETQSEADAKAKANALDARFRALGYKPITRGGLRLYCHNEQQIGSRIERSVCGTPEELEFMALTGRDPGPAGLIGLSGIKFN